MLETSFGKGKKKVASVILRRELGSGLVMRMKTYMCEDLCDLLPSVCVAHFQQLRKASVRSGFSLLRSFPRQRRSRRMHQTNPKPRWRCFDNNTATHRRVFLSSLKLSQEEMEDEELHVGSTLAVRILSMSGPNRWESARVLVATLVRFFSPPNKTLLVRRTVCVFRVNHCLFNSPRRTIPITSKQKFQLPLRALWAPGLPREQSPYIKGRVILVFEAK